MEQALIELVSDLCVNWGFCLPPQSVEEISKQETYHARDFASDVLLAEGMNPEHHLNWFRKISTKFIAHFGTNYIEQTSFEEPDKG